MAEKGEKKKGGCLKKGLYILVGVFMAGLIGNFIAGDPNQSPPTTETKTEVATTITNPGPTTTLQTSPTVVLPEYKLYKSEITKSKAKHHIEVHAAFTAKFNRADLEYLLKQRFREAEAKLAPPAGTPKSVLVSVWDEKGYQGQQGPLAHIRKTARDYTKFPDYEPRPEFIEERLAPIVGPPKKAKPVEVVHALPEYRIIKSDISKTPVKHEIEIHLAVTGNLTKTNLANLLRRIFSSAERKLSPPNGTPKSVLVVAWSEKGYSSSDLPLGNMRKSANDYMKGFSPSMSIFID